MYHQAHTQRTCQFHTLQRKQRTFSGGGGGGGGGFLNVSVGRLGGDDGGSGSRRGALDRVLHGSHLECDRPVHVQPLRHPRRVMLVQWVQARRVEVVVLPPGAAEAVAAPKLAV